MQMLKYVVDVNFECRLLALIATEPPCAATAASGACFDEVLVYFHGFPDVAVHPTKLDLASRMLLKLADALLSSNFASCGDVEVQEIDILRSQLQDQREKLDLLHFPFQRQSEALQQLEERVDDLESKRGVGYRYGQSLEHRGFGCISRRIMIDVHNI